MTRTINHIKHQLLFLILLFVVSGTACRSDENKIKIYKNPEDMKQEILNHIPIGSNIKDAQRIMEANGFKCELSHGDFTVINAGEPGSGVIYHDMDFLYCDKEVSELFSTLESKFLNFLPV